MREPMISSGRTCSLLFVLASMVFSGIVACGGASISDTQSPIQTDTTKAPTQPGSPRTATLLGGALQATVGTSLAVSMMVSDSAGRPVPGVVVNFVVTSGAGSVFAPAVQTSANGSANQQWTLGTKAGTQTMELRWIDPTTGVARVLATDSATAIAGAVQKLFVPPPDFTDQPQTFIGGTLDVRKIVSAQDEYGNTVNAFPIQVQPAAGWTVHGDTLVAPAAPAAGRFQVMSGSISASFVAYAVDDLRRYTFSSAWSCTYLSPFTYNGISVDSTFSSMTVDSVRYSTDPGPRRGIPAFGSLRYIFYASGLTTHYLHGAGSATVREVRDIGIQQQWPDSIRFIVATALGGVPTDGTLPSNRSNTDPALTLAGGPLYRGPGASLTYTSTTSGQLATACVGNGYPLHAMTLTGR